MCHFFSGLIDRHDLDALYLYDGLSHSETARHHRLEPETYREFEWVKDDDGKSLSVRTIPDDPHPESWYRASILARFGTRTALVRHWLETLPKVFPGDLYLYGCDLKGVKLPETVEGSLDLRGCDLKGVKLPAKIGGYLYVHGCDLKGVKLPKEIGGYLDLSGCDLKGVKLPETVEGSLYLSGCDLKGVRLPAKIEGYLDLGGCVNRADLRVPNGVRVIE